MDLGVGGPRGTDRRDLLSELAAWVRATFGHEPGDLALFRRAVTHSSLENEGSYERLEFLGDRVLGLIMAEWLLELFPNEAEGKLSRRINILVSGSVCAEIAREIGAAEQLRLNKQAYDDGAKNSDYVLGDIVESLLGALYLEAGPEAARAWVRSAWADRVHRQDTARKHPKAELQDWALAKQRGTPVYETTDETGPDHAKRHTVAARLGQAQRTAVGSTKREAETEAARLLLAALLEEEPTAPRKRRSAPRRVVLARPATP